MVDYAGLILPIAMMVGVIGSMGGAVWWFYLKDRGKTRVEMYRDMDGRYYKVAGSKVSTLIDTVKKGERMYHLDYAYASMGTGRFGERFAVLRFDVDDAKPLSMEIHDDGVIHTYNPTLFRSIMTTQIYKNILSGVTENAMFILLLIMVGASLLVGAYGAYSAYQSQQAIGYLQQQIAKLLPAK